MENKLNKFIFRLGYIVTLVSIISLYLLSQATQNSKQFEQNYNLLIIITLVGISCLFIIVIFYIIRISKNYFNRTPGSSLSINILIRTLLLAFIPVFFISFFSFKFLHHEFQASFDASINDALNNSLKLSRKALDARALQALRDSNNIAYKIAPFEYKELQIRLDKIRKEVGAYELTIFDEKGFIQAFASLNKNQLFPKIPDHSEFLRASNKSGFFNLETIEVGFQIRVLTSVNKPGAPNYYLQALYRIPDVVSELATQVSKTITERDKFNYLKPKVSNSFVIVLLLVILLASLLLMLSSIGLANYMSKPISDLIKGTKKVAQGDFAQPVIIQRKDDFGTLMESFNQMTNYLGSATKQAENNRVKVESERAYLATIINYMTSAVITLDYKTRLLTYNEHAEQLLGCTLIKAINIEPKFLDMALDSYKNFINQLNIENNKMLSLEKEIQIQDDNQQRQLVVRLTALPSTDERHGGYVIIFDDLTHYWQRQKEAAWEEVARRLAHEIKNPLTPIQLAAERINYKLASTLPEKEKQMLSRSINVIINQVQSMKNMVDEFSAYAKPVVAKKSVIDLHELINSVFDLYNGHYQNIKFVYFPDATQFTTQGNANLFRQVLHNLIKNSIESLDGLASGLITITTYNDKQKIIIKVTDNGIGLKKEVHNIFDPYVSSKQKGTGLGLAIVKKIIDDHQGKIRLESNNDGKGVTVTIELTTTKEKIDESTTV